MDNSKVIYSGRKPKNASTNPNTKHTEIFRSASVIVAIGAIFCASFLGRYATDPTDTVQNHSFDTVYAMAHMDDTIPTGKNESVLTGSIEDGEWSLWAYLEYVISKLVGVS